MGGSENDIYYDETTGLVWKRNRIEVYCLSWRQFFERILLHNLLFPGAPFCFEVVIEYEGELRGVISQADRAGGVTPHIGYLPATPFGELLHPGGARWGASTR